MSLSFFFNDTAITEIYTLSLHDALPIWSDRNGEFNLYSYNTATKKIDQLTSFKDFPVINASGVNGTIVFEQAGYLQDRKSTRLNSSHSQISYAVFCLKKKKKKRAKNKHR